VIEETRLGRTSARRRLAPIVVVALAWLAPATAFAADPVALSVGHTDAVAPAYEADALVMKVKDDTTGGPPVFRDPADVVFHVKAPESEVEVPANPSFAFLGEPGSPLWLLPMTQDPDLLWPGFSSEQITPGVLEGDALSWRLTGVDGPGRVFLFEIGSFGTVSSSFRSDQPLPQSKAMSTGVHAHYNWAFTAPGRYTLTFEVTGTRAGGGQLTTGEVDYTFVIGGFGDLGVELAIDGLRARYAPGDTVTLEAAQRPRTVLDRYDWFVKCPGDADFAAVDGAHGAVYSFPAELDGDGCQYRATVYRPDGEAIATSEPVTVRVEVPFFGGRTVLSAGHVDAVAPYYEDGALAIKVEDDTGETAVVRDPSEVVLHAKTPASEAAVPALEDFAFLGQAGDPVWILPQLQNEEILWAGFSSESIPLGAFAGDELTWTVTDVDGPGHAFLYVEDWLGLPVHRFRSDEPLPQSVTMRTDTHDHFNWAFTAPGRYTLTFKIAGTPVGGGEISSGEAAYQVLIGSYEDLGVRLIVSGAAGERTPGDEVTLTAVQDPRTDLDRYRWFRRCEPAGDYAEVPEASAAGYSFTAQAADDGCRYTAAVYDADRQIAESDPVTLEIRTEPEDPADPQPGPDPTPNPGPGPGTGNEPAGPPVTPRPPAVEPRRPAVRLRAATLRRRILSVRLRSSMKGRATVQLLRNGRVVARGAARSLPKGTHTVRFNLNRALKPGRYRVRVRVVAGGGSTTRTIALRIPKRR
jgi:surface-anchored protein